MYTKQEWLQLKTQDVASIVAQRISTAVIYLNGTRRWFMSQNKNWDDYATVTGGAQRELSQLIYDHGVKTLIQPLLGYDLLERGEKYLRMAVQQGLGELTAPQYRAWFHQSKIRVNFYGRWIEALSEHGFSDIVGALQEIARETASYSKQQLLFGLFADEGLDRIVALSKGVDTGEMLLGKYYGQPVSAVDLIIGAGQPVIWDAPLLDINKASLYFLQAPTFCLHQNTLRQILYDHLYQRVNDNQRFENVSEQAWDNYQVLGIGQQTDGGWVAQ